MMTTTTREPFGRAIPLSLAGQVREPGPREPKGTPKGRIGEDEIRKETKDDTQEPKKERRIERPRPQ